MFLNKLRKQLVGLSQLMRLHQLVCSLQLIVTGNGLILCGRETCVCRNRQNQPK